MKYSLIIISALALSACTPALQSTGDTSVVANLGSGTDEPYLHTVYVGQGNCQIVTCPDSKKAMIFDCGSTSKNDTDKNGYGYHFERTLSSVVESLQLADTTRYTNINVSISHADEDHQNLLPVLGRLIYKKRHPNTKSPSTQAFDMVVLGGDAGSYTPSQVAILAGTMQTDPEKYMYYFNETHSFEPMDSFSCKTGDDKLDALLLVTNATEGKDKNSDSSVFALLTQSLKPFYDYGLAYITGDMTEDTAQKIYHDLDKSTNATNFQKVKKEDDLWVVTTMAHHGSDTEGSNDREWAKFVSANNIIISSPPGNIKSRFNHPRCPAVQEYIDVPIKHRIKRDGEVACHMDNSDSYKELNTKERNFYGGYIPNFTHFMSSVSLRIPNK